MPTLGNVSFNIKNTYDATATYLKDDIVMYNGSWHLCKTDTTAGQSPDTAASFWDAWQSMFNWKGSFNWTAAQKYYVNDVVEVDVPMFIENKTGRMSAGQNFGGADPYAGTAGQIGPTQVTDLTIVTPGVAYSSNPTVTLTGGGATTQATATAVQTAGAVTSLTVVSGGDGYNAVPTVTITGGGSPSTTATATATISDVAGYDEVSRSTYICTSAVTLPATPVQGDYPYSDTSNNWALMSAEFEYDDTDVRSISSWDPTASAIKDAVHKVRADGQGLFTNNYRDCIKLPNKGLVGDNSKYYALGDNKQSTNWHAKGYINGAGGVTRWGSNDGSAAAFEHDIYTAIETVHPFLDWFTSTDQKEWDSFLDGNIEDFRLMKSSPPAVATVPTVAAINDIFTDLLIHSRSETDGSRAFDDDSSNNYTIMPHATLAPDSGNDINHNDYNRNPDGSNKTSGWNQVSHSTDEKLFGTSSIKFGGDGDYLRLQENAKWDLVTATADWYIDFHIRLNDGGKGRGRQTIVEQYYQKDYYWTLYYREHYGFNFEIWWDGSMRFQTGFGGEIYDDDWYFVRLGKTAANVYTIYKATNGAGGLQGTASTTATPILSGTFATTYDMRAGTNTGSLWIGGRGGTSPFNTPDGEPPKCVQLEAGDNHLMMLFNNGEVYHGGYGGHGQNGDQSDSTRSWMQRCGGSYANTYRRYDGGTNGSYHTTYRTRMVRIATSGGQRQESTHSCYSIDEDGFVWSWGYAAHGQNGHGNTTNYNYPRRIDDGTTNTPKSRFGEKAVVGIWAAGQEYGWCHAVDEDGDLWSWGYNGYGQLGDGTTTNRNVPTLIDTGTWVTATRGEITKIQMCGGGSYSSTAILTSTGQVWVTGYNAQGWHGMDNTTTLNVFTRMLFGPGSATWKPGGTPHADNVVSSTKAYNIWYTGNGNHVQLWIRDDLGYQWVCGRNHNKVFGNYAGNTTNKSKPELSYVALPKTTYQDQIAGSMERVHLRNVKAMGCCCGNDGGTAYDRMQLTVVTDEGNSYVTGFNSYGPGSTGHTGSDIGSQSDGSHGLDHQSNGWWQVARGPSYAQGHFVDTVGAGHYQSDDSHWMNLWQTDRNRCLKAGRGNRGNGQHVGGRGHQGEIHPYIMEVVYN